jgi:hypothetical protein
LRCLAATARVEFRSVRALRRAVWRYAWKNGLRELLRSPLISAEARVTSIVMMGLLISPFVLGSAIWWLLTGKRLPGYLGRWFPPPTTVTVNPIPRGLAPDIREFLDRSHTPDAAPGSEPRQSMPYC